MKIDAQINHVATWGGVSARIPETIVRVEHAIASAASVANTAGRLRKEACVYRRDLIGLRDQLRKLKGCKILPDVALPEEASKSALRAESHRIAKALEETGK